MKKAADSTDKEAEKLEALAQEDEKSAVSDTTKILKEEEKKHDQKEAERLDYLYKERQKPSGTVATYCRALATLLEGKMMGVDMPSGWSFIVFPTDVGVILELKYGERMFRSAFKATGMEKYDLNAVNMYVVRAENTIDRVTYRDTNSLHGDN